MPKSPSNLASYTTVENMLRLVDALRKKNNVEEDAKPIFGMGETAYNGAKSALKVFGILESDSASFTPNGRKLAFASDTEKPSILMSIIAHYSPYESVISNIFQRGEAQTDVEAVVGFWGRFNIGSTERNRTDAANLFGSVIEYVGLGKFIRGSRGNPTRIEWNPDARSRFENVQAEQSDDTAVAHLTGSNSTVTVQDVTKTTENYHEPSQTVESIELRQRRFGPKGHDLVPAVNISVDMTTWPDSQIKNFFRWMYGDFNDADI